MSSKLYREQMDSIQPRPWGFSHLRQFYSFIYWRESYSALEEVCHKTLSETELMQLSGIISERRYVSYLLTLRLYTFFKSVASGSEVVVQLQVQFWTLCVKNETIHKVLTQ